MPLTPEETDILQRSFTLFYVSLRLHEEALVHFVCQKLDVPFEVAERELNEWTVQHQDERVRSLQREAHQTLKAAKFPSA
jgi:hypothetical protein